MIDLNRLKSAIFDGTAKEASERTGLSQKTIESYRAKEGSKSYRDWQGMAVKTALEVLEKVSLDKKDASKELVYRSFMVNRSERYKTAMYFDIYSGELKDFAIQVSKDWAKLALRSNGLSKGVGIPASVPSVYLSVSEDNGGLIGYLNTNGELVSRPYDLLRDTFLDIREGIEN